MLPTVRYLQQCYPRWYSLRVTHGGIVSGLPTGVPGGVAETRSTGRCSGDEEYRVVGGDYIPLGVLGYPHSRCTTLYPARPGCTCRHPAAPRCVLGVSAVREAGVNVTWALTPCLLWVAGPGLLFSSQFCLVPSVGSLLASRLSLTNRSRDRMSLG